MGEQQKNGDHAFFIADKSEIITARKRDEEQIQLLAEQLSPAIRSLVGDRLWIRIYRSLPTIVRLLYFSATDLLQRQTPGEEYLTLMQVDSNGRLLLTWQRVLFVVLEAFGQVLVQKCTQSPRFTAMMQAMMRRWSLLSSFSAILRWVDLSYVNQAVFFALNTAFLTIPMRIAGVHYLTMRPQTSPARRLFTFIGWCIIVQYSLALIISLRSLWKNWLSEENGIDSPESSKAVDELGDRHTRHKDFLRICAICAEPKLMVCTPCGHCYCWPCIHAASSLAGESGYTKCPQCRKEFPLNRVVPLMN